MTSPPAKESRWIGRVLRDTWRIDRKIARGGMGTVFLATSRRTGELAAVKILHPELSHDADTRSRFLQEGYAANQVGHPGVVKILDDDVTDEGFAYLVMELLHGELLEQRRIRSGGRLPVAEVLDAGDQLLDVLAAAHDKGIIHRDIKPDNLFVVPGASGSGLGRLKLLDFGFARMKSGFRREQTATGYLLGTPGFMAPEQASGDQPRIDAQTDLWSVGATLFVLLTGQPVHAGEGQTELLLAAVNSPARSIRTLEPRLPTKLAAAVDRALAFDKQDRFADALEMQLALRSVAGGAQGPPVKTFDDDIPSSSSEAPTRMRDASELGHFAPQEDRAPPTEDVNLPVSEAPVTPTLRDPHPADLDRATIAEVRRDGPTLAAARAPVPAPPDPRETARSGSDSAMRTVALAAPPARAPYVAQGSGSGALPQLGDVPTEGTLVMDTSPRRSASMEAGRTAAPSFERALPPAVAMQVTLPLGAAPLPLGAGPPMLGAAPLPPPVAARPRGIEPHGRGYRSDAVEDDHLPPSALPKMLVYALISVITAVAVILVGLLVILATE